MTFGDSSAAQLLPGPSGKDTHDIPVMKLAAHQKMTFLRRFYLILTVELTAFLTTGSILFFTPNVRGFVQQEQWCRWLIYGAMFVGWAFAFKMESTSAVRCISWLLLTTVNTLGFSLLVLYNDNEVLLHVCALACGIMLTFFLFCTQTKIRFNWKIASLCSIPIAVVFSMFLEVAMMIFNYDYILNVSACTAFITYVNFVGYHSMRTYPMGDYVRSVNDVCLLIPKKIAAALSAH